MVVDVVDVELGRDAEEIRCVAVWVIIVTFMYFSRHGTYPSICMHCMHAAWIYRQILVISLPTVCKTIIWVIHP